MGNEKNIILASEWIQKMKVTNVVIDPVIACKGTAQILQPKSVEGIKNHLLPHGLIATPNLVEAGILSGLGDLTTLDEVKEAARLIHQRGVKNVVVKGGRRFASEKAVDVFYDGKDFEVLEGEMIATDFNHGAGCTFAAAITAGVAKGMPVLEAVVVAKDFVAAAIKQGVAINPHVGHVWHGAYHQAENRIGQVSNHD